MSVSFVANGALAENNTTTSMNIAAPTGMEDGDIMIAVVINKALTNVISPPDGTWTEIYQAQGNCTIGADDHRVAIFWKLALASDSGDNFAFTKATDDNVLFAGVISAWRGADQQKPLDPTAVGATVTAGANENVAFPAFDPTRTNVEVIYVAVYGNDQTTFAAAMSADTNPDCTTRFDLETATGNDVTIALTSGNNNGSNIASRTWDSNSTTDAGSSGIVFALQAATNPSVNDAITVTESVGVGIVHNVNPPDSQGVKIYDF